MAGQVYEPIMQASQPVQIARSIIALSCFPAYGKARMSFAISSTSHIYQLQPPNSGAGASSLCTAASVEVTRTPAQGQAQGQAQALASTEVTVQCTKPITQTTESASYYQSEEPSPLTHG